MRSSAVLFMAIVLLSLIACGKQSIQDIEKFDPQFHVGDYLNEQIINRTGGTVSIKDPKFNDFACLHVDKVKELNIILNRYRRRTPLKVRKEVKELIEELEKDEIIEPQP